MKVPWKEKISVPKNHSRLYVCKFLIALVHFRIAIARLGALGVIGLYFSHDLIEMAVMKDPAEGFCKCVGNIV